MASRPASRESRVLAATPPPRRHARGQARKEPLQQNISPNALECIKEGSMAGDLSHPRFPTGGGGFNDSRRCAAGGGANQQKPRLPGSIPGNQKTNGNIHCPKGLPAGNKGSAKSAAEETQARCPGEAAYLPTAWILEARAGDIDSKSVGLPKGRAEGRRSSAFAHRSEIRKGNPLQRNAFALVQKPCGRRSAAEKNHPQEEEGGEIISRRGRSWNRGEGGPTIRKSRARASFREKGSNTTPSQAKLTRGDADAPHRQHET